MGAIVVFTALSQVLSFFSPQLGGPKGIRTTKSDKVPAVNYCTPSMPAGADCTFNLLDRP